MIAISYSDIAHIFSLERKEERSEFSTLIQSESGSALDVPCASGFRLKYLLEKHSEVYGVDISDKMLEICNLEIGKLRNSNIHLMQLDLKNIVQIGKKFDVVYILEYAIQFLSNSEIKKLLSELHQIGKKFYIEIYDYSRCFIPEKKEFFLENNKGILLQVNYFCSEDRVRIRKTYQIDNKIYTQEIKMYNYKLKRFLKLLSDCDLKVCGIYKNYQKVSYERNNPRAILEICTE